MRSNIAAVQKVARYPPPEAATITNLGLDSPAATRLRQLSRGARTSMSGAVGPAETPHGVRICSGSLLIFFASISYADLLSQQTIPGISYLNSTKFPR